MHVTGSRSGRARPTRTEMRPVDVNTPSASRQRSPGGAVVSILLLKPGFDLCLLRMKPFGKAR